MVSKKAAMFLICAGVFNALIWPRFARAIVADDRAWSGRAWESAPTGFLVVHAVLISTAMLIALAVLWIGWRAYRTQPTAVTRP